jgi:hypothetical protein
VDKEEFMQEYLSRLAFSLAQFWGLSDELPADEIDCETYYRVAISRLSVMRRAELAKAMRTLCEPGGGFFSPDTPKDERTRLINDVIARFPKLYDAEHEAVIKNDWI